jgi:hypothetical protein
VLALRWDGDVDEGPGPGRPAGDLAPADDARRLWFARDGLAVELWVPREPRGRVLVGRIVPARAAVVEVESAVGAGDPSGARSCGGVLAALSDVDGWFTLPVEGGGPLRLLVRRPGRPSVATSWMLLDRA